MVDEQTSPSTPRRRKPKREPIRQEGHDAALSRLLSRGAQALSDAELVAMLLGKEDSGLGRAQELITACGGTSGLLREDLGVTERMRIACDLTGLELVDHLVLGGKLWISVRRLKGW